MKVDCLSSGFTVSITTASFGDLLVRVFFCGILILLFFVFSLLFKFGITGLHVDIFDTPLLMLGLKIPNFVVFILFVKFTLFTTLCVLETVVVFRGTNLDIIGVLILVFALPALTTTGVVGFLTELIVF